MCCCFVSHRNVRKIAPHIETFSLYEVMDWSKWSDFHQNFGFHNIDNLQTCKFTENCLQQNSSVNATRAKRAGPVGKGKTNGRHKTRHRV
jgi:hypothetical protein